MLERVPISTMNKKSHCMDKPGTRKELSEDMTRESLIAISYGLPDNYPTDVAFRGEINGVKKVNQPLDSDGDEKLRSKLISISDLPPPEGNVLLPLPQEINS
ncbi:Unknown protein [Striga hermonthica]|uniref:Uncharacterized protein n=1 Tax=Striga hermonthica TaxID=68872 RepID=A0A9N7P4D2_STRHE|nr:Unknown protein [Striga hermonthica]